MLHQFFETGEFHIFRRNTVDGREAASVVNIHTVQEFFYRGFMNENFKIFRRVYVIVDDTVISGVNAEVLEADPVDTDDIARTGMERYNAIVDSVNLDEVRKKAKKDLGMVDASDSQVVEYKKPSLDYVKQYESIPKEGALTKVQTKKSK